MLTKKYIMYNKENYLDDLKLINDEIKILESNKDLIKNRYIENNKPCNLGDFVKIKLNSGRVVKGEVSSFGILKDFTVCITSYKDINDNKKVKYITVPHLTVEYLSVEVN